MTIRCTMVLWFVLAFSHATFAQLLPRPLQDSDKFASPILTIRPKFPDREPTDIFPVEIRITGNINEAGVLTSPTFSPAEGKEKFVRAIEEVLPQWRFQPATSSLTCAPVESFRTLLVWFEEKEGRPIVSVSAAVTDQARNVPDDGKTRDKPRTYEWHPKLEYPEAASRIGMEGAAALLFKVNNQGNVLQTKLLYSTPHKIFGEEAVRASRRVKMSPAAPEIEPAKTTCILQEFTFCISGGIVEYPDSTCAKRRRQS